VESDDPWVFEIVPGRIANVYKYVTRKVRLERKLRRT
jgi:hypothetical protein